MKSLSDILAKNEGLEAESTQSLGIREAPMVAYLSIKSRQVCSKPAAIAEGTDNER